MPNNTVFVMYDGSHTIPLIPIVKYNKLADRANVVMKNSLFVYSQTYRM